MNKKLLYEPKEVDKSEEKPYRTKAYIFDITICSSAYLVSYLKIFTNL